MAKGQAAVAVPYVVLVGALAGVSHSQPDQTFGWIWAVCLILCLPVLVVALPFVYIIGAGIWNLSNADSGGPMWPVTLVYVAMFAAIAIGNCFLLAPLASRIRRRGIGRDPAV